MQHLCDIREFEEASLRQMEAEKDKHRLTEADVDEFIYRAYQYYNLHRGAPHKVEHQAMIRAFVRCENKISAQMSVKELYDNLRAKACSAFPDLNSRTWLKYNSLTAALAKFKDNELDRTDLHDPDLQARILARYQNQAQ